LPKIVQKEEIFNLLDNLNNLEKLGYSKFYANMYKVMIFILYSTGMRVTELVTMRFDNIQAKFLTDEKKFKLTNSTIVIKGKGNKERLCILASSVINLLEDYILLREIFLTKNNAKNVYLFPSKELFKSTHVSRQNFALVLKKISSNIGIDVTKISPHILRHSFATDMLKGGADLRVVQELLGHQSLATTQIYTHIAKDELNLVIKTYHPLCK
jgi:integrase/recombinase XerD